MSSPLLMRGRAPHKSYLKGCAETRDGAAQFPKPQCVIDDVRTTLIAVSTARSLQDLVDLGHTVRIPIELAPVHARTSRFRVPRISHTLIRIDRMGEVSSWLWRLEHSASSRHCHDAHARYLCAFSTVVTAVFCKVQPDCDSHSSVKTDVTSAMLVDEIVARCDAGTTGLPHYGLSTVTHPANPILSHKLLQSRNQHI